MNHKEISAIVPERDKQAEETLSKCYGVECGVWTEPMLSALEGGLKGNKWFSLIDKVMAPRTLELAWAKVKSNAGGCGVDGITVARFEKTAQDGLLALNEHLNKGVYQPKPAKRVWIPKPGSTEQRPIGIPTVRDRIVETSLKMVIEPIFESSFHPQSYGFRPGRGAKDALRQVDRKLRAGYLHVVDVDIKGYFDSISQSRLMELVRERISDGRVLRLLESFLERGVMEMTNWEASERGTPQGGVISPLLANIYLDALDWEMASLGFEMVRYADDMVVLCRTKEEAQAALEHLREWMEGAELTLHPDKTKLTDMREARASFEFLGYRFERSQRGRLNRFIRKKSLLKLRHSIRDKTPRNNGHSMDTTITRVNKTLRGIYVYFKHAHTSQLEEIDRWVRGRLRAILRKRRGLRGLGRGADHQRWPNRYFSELGLFSLLEARNSEMLSLRNGANS